MSSGHRLLFSRLGLTLLSRAYMYRCTGPAQSVPFFCAFRHCTDIEEIAGPKMIRNPFGGGATNERPAGVKASSSDDDTSKCRSKLNTRRRCMEDVYKARCADLERQIVQLKIELAEAKVCICVSSIVVSDACYFVLPRTATLLPTFKNYVVHVQ